MKGPIKTAIALAALAYGAQALWSIGISPSDGDDVIASGPQLHASADGPCAVQANDARTHEAIVDRCVTLAAQAADEADRSASLLTAAEVLRLDRPDAADRMQMDLASAGDVHALTAFGSAEPADEGDRLVRREALIEAERLGDAEAVEVLESRFRSVYAHRALARPEILAQLEEGRLRLVPDTLLDRRYLVALGQAAATACPFESAVFRNAEFQARQDAFEAPIRTEAHTRLWAEGPAVVRDLVASAGEFVQSVEQDGYRVAGARLLQRAIHDQKVLNQAGSTASSAGARDGARIPTIHGGCGQAPVLRIARSLQHLYGERAAFVPGATPAHGAADARASRSRRPGRLHADDDCASIDATATRTPDAAQYERALACLSQSNERAGDALRVALAWRAGEADRGGLVDRSVPLIDARAELKSRP